MPRSAASRSASGLLLAVDPDPHGGTWVRMNRNGEVNAFQLQEPTERLIKIVCGAISPDDHVIVEGIQSYGMKVGATVFETVKNIGEVRAWARARGNPFDDTLTRPQIKSALCHSAKATDANVNAALYDLYGDGTPASCKGTKAAPGPLYGFKADLWAALALGVVWLAKRGLGPLAARDGIESGRIERELGRVSDNRERSASAS